MNGLEGYVTPPNPIPLPLKTSKQRELNSLSSHFPQVSSLPFSSIHIVMVHDLRSHMADFHTLCTEFLAEHSQPFTTFSQNIKETKAPLHKLLAWNMPWSNLDTKTYRANTNTKYIVFPHITLYFSSLICC